MFIVTELRHSAIQITENDKCGIVGAALVLVMPVIIVRLQVQCELSMIYFIEYHEVTMLHTPESTQGRDQRVNAMFGTRLWVLATQVGPLPLRIVFFKNSLSIHVKSLYR
jgi:hypothetical protein